MIKEPLLNKLILQELKADPRLYNDFIIRRYCLIHKSNKGDDRLEIKIDFSRGREFSIAELNSDLFIRLSKYIDIERITHFSCKNLIITGVIDRDFFQLIKGNLVSISFENCYINQFPNNLFRNLNLDSLTICKNLFSYAQTNLNLTDLRTLKLGFAMIGNEFVQNKDNITIDNSTVRLVENLESIGIDSKINVINIINNKPQVDFIGLFHSIQSNKITEITNLKFDINKDFIEKMKLHKIFTDGMRRLFIDRLALRLDSSLFDKDYKFDLSTFLFDIDTLELRCDQSIDRMHIFFEEILEYANRVIIE
ncbi:MAG: hypothetical protein HeimC2_14030 [Candidatus Heimdallarchaeota archaeon LC_2]|nr:MAG: hypothetical protein HeimC2_14030 [Candidatus Heimdallarchaeota archaeon LC_2]